VHETAVAEILQLAGTCLKDEGMQQNIGEAWQTPR
jgi:hypothetical protein